MANDVLDYFRTEVDPRFRDVPDAELTDFIQATYPKFLKDPKFRIQERARIGQAANVAGTAEENVPDGLGDNPYLPLPAAMEEALGQGMAQMAGSLGQFSKAISQIPGQGIGELSGIGPYLRTYSDVSESLTPQTSLHDIAQAYREHGLLAAAQETSAGTAGLALQQVPQMVASAVTGGGSTALGLSPRAAAILASIATTLPQETGGAYEEIGQRTGEQGPAAAAAALGVGGVNSALELAGDIPILERLLGGGTRLASDTVRQVAARFGLNVAKSVFGEAVTEAAQEVGPALAPSLFGADAPSNLPERMGEAAFGGAAGGLAFGGASALSAMRSAPQERVIHRNILAPPVIPQGAAEPALQTFVPQAPTDAGIEPTPGTFQSTLKHGLVEDVRRSIDAVASGRKPAALPGSVALSSFGPLPSGLVAFNQDPSTDGRTIVTRQGDTKSFQAVMDALSAGEDPDSVALGKALGYTDLEIEQFKERKKAYLASLPAPTLDPGVALASIQANERNAALIGNAAALQAEQSQIAAAGQAKLVEIDQTPVPQAQDPILAGIQASEKAQAKLDALLQTVVAQKRAAMARNPVALLPERVAPAPVAVPEIAPPEAVPEATPAAPVLSEKDTSISDAAPVAPVVVAPAPKRGVNAGLKAYQDRRRAAKAALTQQQTPAPNVPVVSAESVPVRPLPQGGKGVRVQDTQGNQAALPRPQEAVVPQAPQATQPDALTNFVPPHKSALQRDTEAEVGKKIVFKHGGKWRLGTITSRVNMYTPHVHIIEVGEGGGNWGGYDISFKPDIHIPNGELESYHTYPAPVELQPKAAANPVAEAIAEHLQLTGHPEAVAKLPAELQAPVVEAMARTPRKPNPMREGVGRNSAKVKADPMRQGLDMTTAKGRRELKARKKAAAGITVAVEPAKPLAVIRQDYPDNPDPKLLQAELQIANSRAMKSADTLTPAEQKRVDWDNGIRREGEAEPKQTNKTRWVAFRNRLGPYLESALADANINDNGKLAVMHSILRDQAKRWADAEDAGTEFGGFVQMVRKDKEKQRLTVDINTTRAMNRKLGEILQTQKNEVQSPASTEAAHPETSESTTSPDVATAITKQYLWQQTHDAMMEKYRENIAKEAERISGITLTEPQKQHLLWQLGEDLLATRNDFPEPAQKFPEIPELAKKVAKSLTKEAVRKALASAPLTPITLTEVTAALSEATGGKLPLNVTVIDDPNHVLPNGDSGRNTAGYVVRNADGTFRIVLNAAFISSRIHAVKVLAEEAVHVVWEAPEIQDAWAKFKAALTPADLEAKKKEGYKGEELLEEAAVAKVLSLLENSGPRSLAQQSFLTRLWAKVKEFLGLSGDTLEDAKDRIMARAIRALHQGGPLLPGWSVRKSLTGAIKASLKDRIQTFIKASEQVLSRTTYGLRKETADSKSYVLGWSNGSARWDLLKGGSFRKDIPRFSDMKDPYNPAVRRDWFEKYGKESDRVEIPKGVEVELDANQVLIAAGSRAQAIELAQFLPPLPLYKFSHEQMPVMGALAHLSPNNELFRELGVDPKEFFSHPDSSEALDRYLDHLNSAPQVRKSIVQGYFKNQNDVAASLPELGPTTGPGRATISVASQLQGKLIPDSIKETVSNLAVGPGSTDSDHQAARYLRTISNVAALADTTDAEYMAHIGGPISASLVSDPSVPAMAKHTAAEAVVLSDNLYRNQLSGFQEKLAKAEEAFEEAVKDRPKSASLHADADIARNQGEELIRAMMTMLRLENMTSSKSYSAQEKIEAKAAADSLTEARRNTATAIGAGLQAIAAQIPESVLGSEDATRGWIVNRQTDPEQSRVFSADVWKFLTTRLDRRRRTPITGFGKFASVITKLRNIQLNKDEAESQLNEMRKEFHGAALPSGKGKKVPVRQAFQTYANLKAKYTKGMALARAINQNIERRARNVEAYQKSVDVLTQLVSHPSYRASVQSGIDELNAMTPAIMQIPKTLAGYNGIVHYNDPITGKVVDLNFTPSLARREEFNEKLSSLLANVQIYLGQENADPYLVASWTRVYPVLEQLFQASPGNLTTIMPDSVPFIGGMRIPSLWSLMRRVMAKRPGSFNNIAHKIGGPAAVSALRASAARDVVALKFEQMRDERGDVQPSQTRINRGMVEAMPAHGLDPANTIEQEIWDEEVANEIASQNSTPGSIPYAVGDKTPDGHTIGEADVKAVKAQKSWSQAVMDTLQRAEKGSVADVLWHNPVLTQVTVGARVLARSAVDYGFKMSRDISQRGRRLVREWIEGNEADRSSMLRREYKRLVLKMATESNPEFNWLPVDEKDKVLFSEIRKLSRAGELPFTDYEGFLDWIAERREEDSEGASDEVSEREAAEERIAGYVGTYMDRGNTMFNVSPNNSDGTPRRDIPPASNAIASVDNEFLRPRGALYLPSSFYTTTVSGSQRQETFKANALNIMMGRELAHWTAVKATLERRMEDYQERIKQAVAEGSGLARARLNLSTQSRAEFLSDKDIADYATVRDQVGFLEAMLSELGRRFTEHNNTIEDLPSVLLGRRVLGSVSANLLAAPGAVMRNYGGAAWINSVQAHSLNQTNAWFFGGKFLGNSVRQIVGRVTGIAANRIPTFKAWLAAGGSRFVRALSDAMVFAYQSRQGAINALALDRQNTQQEIQARKALAATGGVPTPGELTPPLISLWNRFGAWGPIPYITSYTARFAPGFVDRAANAAVSELARMPINDEKWLGSIWDVWKAREERNPTGYANLSVPSSRFSVGEFAGRENTKSLQEYRDLLTPIGSLEQLSLNWYERAKAVGPEARYKTPFFENQGLEDSYVQQWEKRTNLPTPSTGQEFFKGVGFNGLIKATFGMFTRYGFNLSEVKENMSARSAERVSPEQSQKDTFIRWTNAAQWAAALVLVALLANGASDLWKRFFEHQTIATQSIGQVLENPSIADVARYTASNIGFMLPYGGDQLSQVLGGTSPRPLFDLTAAVPLASIAANLGDTAKKIYQTKSLRFPLEDLSRQIFPVTRGPINWFEGGDVIRRQASGAIRAAAPVSMELRGGGSAGQIRQTPSTVLVRAAVDAALVGDKKGYEAAFKKAVDYRVSTGMTPEEATKAVENSIKGQDPLKLTVGRKLTATEEANLVSRMRPFQREAYTRAVSILRGPGRTAKNPLRGAMARSRNPLRGGGRAGRRGGSVMRQGASSVLSRI